MCRESSMALSGDGVFLSGSSLILASHPLSSILCTMRPRLHLEPG